MNFRFFFALFLAATVTCLPSAAQADWYEAQSEHFVIYADDSEKDILRFTENLERYHSAMEILLGRDLSNPSPSNRVTIFVVGDDKDMSNLSGSRAIGGFYIPRAGASRAFVQEIRNQNGYPHRSTIILLHEYAHHFLISSSRFAMPRWMSEGMAEFFAAATFEGDGSLLIGRYAQHRQWEVGGPVPVSVQELLDPEVLRKNRGPNDNGFYGRAWLLFHYLTFSEDRSGQLEEYQRRLAQGESSLDAGKRAFGDLEKLDTELSAYSRAPTMKAERVPAEKLSKSSINLRKLPDGEARMMQFRIVSQRGVDREQATELLEDVRKVAKKYPDDPGVLSALAEAEYDAGNDLEAVAAADRAIALDPTRVNPYVQKGFALFRQADAVDEPDRESAYDKAMKPFSALNARENDHPLPLIFYYRSFVEKGEEPTEQAKTALEMAARLAPFDQGLWMQVAMMQAEEGKIALAKDSLRPLIANPHGGSQVEFARRFIDILDQAKEGERVYFRISDDDAAIDTGEADTGDEAESFRPENERLD